MIQCKRIYEVKCDECGSSLEGTFDTKNDALMALKHDEEWLRYKGRIYCPVCAEQHITKIEAEHIKTSPKEYWKRWYDTMMSNPEMHEAFLVRKRQRYRNAVLKKLQEGKNPNE